MLAVAGIFAGVLALIVTRALDLTVLRGPDLVRMAASQHRARIELTPHRGPILDRHGDALALSLDVPSIFVRPREWKGQEAQTPQLARAVGLPLRAAQKKLASDKPFVWLRRQVSPRQADAVKALGLRGVYTVNEGRRLYPHNMLAAHVLGFVGVDSQGLEGLERKLDRAIRGASHDIEADRDARGRQIFTSGVPDAPVKGSSVELTIDDSIQDVAERELAKGVASAKAIGGSALVLDPHTGELLALANVPTYNPNQPGSASDPAWRNRIRNRALTDPFEPGSTFKAVLAAAAIEEKVVSPTTSIFCENGRMKIGRWTINDTHKHDWLTFAEVIQVSSNIGASKVAERLGAERYYRYLQAFGFGARTGIELPGESPGIMRPVSAWSRIDLATHSFGQGVSVTPLQMAVAFGAIANGGLIMSPYVVRRVVSPEGVVVQENKPVVVRRVVSERTARTVTALLRRVVEEKGGTGERARMEGYAVAGKTGTAQKVNLEKGGYSSKRIGSFVGFVPADDPRAVIAVLIDEPSTSSYGGVVAAPVFRAIAASTLQRLGVPPAPAPPEVEMAAVGPAKPRRAKAAPAAKKKTRAGNASEPAAPAEPATPNLIGLSRREAVTRAQAEGFSVRVSGVGYVNGQEPAPGAPYDRERTLALRLSPEITTASP
jgi:cell division protein FtsI (penicillin-binding protein 3)